MTYGTFPGPISDVKLGHEVRISIYYLCHVLYSEIMVLSDSRTVKLSELSDYRILRLLICWKCRISYFEWKLLDRLIRIVGMVGFSDSRTVRFSELLDNWIVGQSDSWIVWQSDCWNCQNCQIIKIVGLLIC